MIEEFFRHNLWANLRLIDHLIALEEKLLEARIDGTYGTVHDTLTHLVAAEARYVAALRDAERPEMPGDGAGVPLAELRSMAERSGQALVELSNSFEPGAHGHREFEGKRWEIARHVVLVQAINHATEHRAHVVTTLSAHGVEAIDLDSWTWGAATGAFKPA